MTRREFIELLGGVAAAFSSALPLSARAQQAKTFRIGILNFDNPEPLGSMLRAALRDRGYTEGQNVKFESKAASGDRRRLELLAAELVGLNTDVIVAYPTPAIIAVKQLTKDIPIVMLAAGDPVATGVVASLSRPGGNVTGTSSTASEAGAKTLEVIHDLLPAVRRVAVLANATDPFSKSFLEQMRHGAEALHLEIRSIPIERADELDAAFATIKNDGADAVVVQPSLPRVRVTELALRYRVPSIAPTRSFAPVGGLASFAASNNEMAQRTASIIDKILKGSKPADLPVEQPTTFELIINLKTAKALGIQVSPQLLARADEVIE